MKKTVFIVLISMSFGLAGCGSAPTAMNTNSPPKTSPTAAGTPLLTQTNTTSSSNDMKSADSKKNMNADKKSDDKKSDTKPPTPTATPPPVSEKVEKKDETLFSFPPPKVTDVTEIKAPELKAVGGQTNLSQVSETLAAGLREAGYKDKFSYFWNESDEFAIVTAMERVNADGSKFVEDRWVTNDNLQGADSLRTYFTYLFSGKKVFYRVFAFVVSARRTQKSFRNGSPPEFITALNWKNKGEDELGDGTTTTIENVLFSEKHKCFVLVYLFVNHTSLDAPKSVDALDKNEIQLQDELIKEAGVHITNTNLKFGG